MNIKKSLVLAGAAATLGVAGIGGLGVASAATNSSSSGNSLVQKIADKFNLNKSDVQAVFDENRAEHKAERQQRLEDRLTQDVTDGKITADQKAKILAKVAELESQRDANREVWADKTPDERLGAMQQKRAELEQWAKDNNIPMQYLHVGMGGHRGHMMSDAPDSDADDN